MRLKVPAINRLPLAILEKLPFAAFCPLLAVVFDGFNIADGNSKLMMEPIANFAERLKWVDG